MLMTYFDTSFTVQFYQVFHDFLGILVVHVQSFRALHHQQNLLIFVPIPWKFFKYHDTACFSKYNFVTLKQHMEKQYSTHYKILITYSLKI